MVLFIMQVRVFAPPAGATGCQWQEVLNVTVLLKEYAQQTRWQVRALSV